jgi:hypothetical protein
MGFSVYPSVCKMVLMRLVGVQLGEVGFEVKLMVVFWEVGGGYGGFAVENGRRRLVVFMVGERERESC